MYGYRIDVSGNWNVSLGPIAFKQTGHAVTGTLGIGSYTGKLNGTLNNTVLTGTWQASFFPALTGKLQLQFSPDGRSYQGYVSFGGQNLPVYGSRM